MTIISILRMLRAKQWVKNAFIFFPLIFSGHALDLIYIQNSLLAFFAFCLISSGVYIFNDLIDVEKDKLHPQKSKRLKIYSLLNKNIIIAIMVVLLIVGFYVSSTLNSLVACIVLFYVILNLIYNLIAKRLVILDVIFIATGFYLRVLAGAFAISVMPSEWLQMCVFLLALFLGFTKRRLELSTLGENAAKHRSVLAQYTTNFLDQLILICSTLAIVFYGLYTISPDIIHRIVNRNMVYSLVFVIYGFFRYLYLVHIKKTGEDPSEVLISDSALLICVVLWISYVGLLIYMPHINF